MSFLLLPGQKDQVQGIISMFSKMSRMFCVGHVCLIFKNLTSIMGLLRYSHQLNLACEQFIRNSPLLTSQEFKGQGRLKFKCLVKSSLNRKTPTDSYFSYRSNLDSLCHPPQYQHSHHISSFKILPTAILHSISVDVLTDYNSSLIFVQLLDQCPSPFKRGSTCFRSLLPDILTSSMLGIPHICWLLKQSRWS